MLVGSAQKSFQVPQDLLIQRSSAPGKMYRLVSDGTAMGTIKLPDVKSSTFKDFFIWLNTHEPSLKSTNMMAVFNLAIFADVYSICDLMNQTSDVIRAALSASIWQLTPDLVSRVYGSTPSGSILRRLCSSAFTTNKPRQLSDLSRWKPIFEQYADLGWDYFDQMQISSWQCSGPKPVIDCSFHDHSNVPGWQGVDEHKCPYSRGTPLSVLNLEDVSRGFYRLQEKDGSQCRKEGLRYQAPPNEVVVHQAEISEEPVN